VHAALRERLRRWVTAAANPLLLWPRLQVDLGPRSPWGRVVRLRREVHALLGAEIARRRAEPAGRRQDVLSLLLAARDEQGRSLRDDELRDQLVTLLGAGHETTASALAFAINRILGTPAVLAAARGELDRVVGSGPVEPGHIGRLEYLDAVVKESLRLDPVVPDVGRRLTRPHRIGGWELPRGVTVVPAIYLTHRHPEVWEEPDVFRPERFLGRRVDPYAFFPFGGGIRRCIGMAFAAYEMKVVLAQVLSRLELRVAPGYRFRPTRRGVTLAPSQGMPVVVTRRAA
jgi:cytochrome P450